MFKRVSVYLPLFAFAFLSLAASAEVRTLCNGNENNVWSCQARKKIYSLCASSDLGSSKGYLQYRAGTTKSTDFKFPAALTHPKGLFKFGLLAHGASISFNNGDYSYFIGEDIKGGAYINVEKSGHSIATINCMDSTDSLTLNSTIDLFTVAGIAE